MSKRKIVNSSEPIKKMRPALTPESRELQMISLAMDLVEERLRKGTASSQETTHFLKLGSIRAQTELEKMRLENELISAKTKAVNSGESSEQLYAEAIKSFQRYSGTFQESDEDD